MKSITMKTWLIIATFLSSFSINAEVTIIYNVKGQTINQYELTKFNAIAFEFGRILGIGIKDVLSKSYPNAMLLDGEGQSMLPGLHDSHTNMMQTVFMSNQVNLRGTKSVAEALSRIQNFIDAHPNNQWIEGYGWDHKQWEKAKLPSHKDLDRLMTQKPIWLRSDNRKTGWANFHAIKLTKAYKRKSSPPGGQIVFGKKRKHTGIYIDSAINVIQPHIKVLSPEKKYDALAKNLKKMAAFGITSLNDTGIDFRTSTMYKALANSQQLPIRVNVSLSSAEKKINLINRSVYRKNHR